MAVTVDAIQFFSGFGLAAALLFAYLNRNGNPAACFIACLLGSEPARFRTRDPQVAWNIPAYRNLTLRLMEPLGAPEQTQATLQTPSPPSNQSATITLDNVTVRAAGHTILENINLEIPARSHVAIVGPSGAGSRIRWIAPWLSIALPKAASSPMASSSTVRTLKRCVLKSRGSTQPSSYGIAA